MIKIGKIYKIVSSQCDDVYIGSTFNELRHRFKQHKQDYEKYKKGNYNKTSVYDLFDKHHLSTFSILLIKEYEVCDRQHLEVYEQLWINKTKCINSQNPFCIKHLTRKDFYEKNKENILEDRKVYYKRNTEKVKVTQKKYRLKNSNKLSQYQKSYRELNVDPRSLIIINCECGSTVQKKALNNHLKSKKHLSYVQTILI